MWRGQDKVWMHYLNDIIAADLYSAVFLSSYLRQSAISCSYCHFLEVIDLQKYRLIRKYAKVRLAMAEGRNMPFVFTVGKN